MSDIVIRLVVDDSQKVRFQKFAAEAERNLLKVDNQFSRVLASQAGVLNGIGGMANTAILTGVGMLTAKVAGLAYAFQGLGREFIRVNEQFGDLEITLGSALKSMTAATKITKELVSITAQSPIPLESLSRAVQSFSVIPQTSTMLRKQSLNDTLGDPNGFLRKSLRTVEQMSVFRPDQGPEGAIFAIREALGGQMRSLIRRFDIPSRYLTQVSGRTTKDLTENPELLMKSLSEMFSNIISPEAVVKFARQPKNLYANYVEQLTTLPMYSIGHRDQNTGADPYGHFLMRAQETFDKLSEFIKEGGPFETKFAGRFRSALERASGSVSDAAMRLVDKLLDSMGIATSGDRMDRIAEGLTRGFEKISGWVSDFMQSISSSDIVPEFLKLIKDFVGFIGTLGSGLKRIADTFGTVPAIIAALSAPKLLSNLGGILSAITNFSQRLFNVTRGVPAEALYGDLSVAGAGGAGGIFSTGVGPSGYVKRKEAMLLQSKLARLADMSPATMGTPTWFGLDMYKGNYGKAELDDAFQQYRAFAAKDPYIRTAANSSHLLKSGGVSAAGLRYAFDRDFGSLRAGGDLHDVFLASSAMGMTSGQLVGSSAKGLLNVKTPGIMSRVGAGAMALAGGMLPGLAIGAGVAALTVGITTLAEQMTFQTKATEANTQAIMSSINQRWENWEQSPMFKFAQLAMGSKMNTGEGARQQEQAKQLIGLVESFGVKNKSGRITGVDGSSGLLWDSTAVSRLKEMGGTKAAEQLTRLKDFGVEGLDPLIAELGKAETDLRESIQQSARSARPVAGDMLGGGSLTNLADYTSYNLVIDKVGDSLAKILGSPENIRNIQARIDSAQTAQISKAQTASFGSLSQRFSGIDPDLLKLIATQGISSTNWAEIQANRMGAKLGGKRSMSDIISEGQSLTDPFAMSAYTEAQTSMESMMDKHAPYMRQLQSFLRFQTKTNEAISLSQTLLSQFDAQAGSMRADLDALLPQLDELSKQLGNGSEGDYVRQLAETIRKNKGTLSSGHLGAVRAQMVERAKNLQDAVRTTATGGAVGSMVDLSSHMDQLNPEEMSDFNMKMNAMLKSAGVNISSDFSAVLQKGQGTAQQLVASYQSFYDKFENMSKVLDESITKQLADITNEIARLGGSGGDKADIEALQDKSNQLTALQRALAGARLENSGRRDSTQGTLLEQRLSQISEESQTKMTREQLYNPQMTRLYVLEQQKITNETKKQAVEESRLADKTKYLVELTEERKRIETEITFLKEGQTLKGFGEGLTESLRTATDDLYDFRQVGIEVGTSIKQHLGDAFGDFVIGAKSAGEAMRGFAVSVLQEASRMMASKAVAGMLSMFVDIFAGAMSGSGSGTAVDQGAGGFMSNGSGYASAADVSMAAAGGPVFGGSGVRDDVPYLLMGGEYVVRKAAVQKYGIGFMHSLNEGSIGSYAAGGFVGDVGRGAYATNGGGGDTYITINISGDGQSSMSGSNSKSDDAGFAVEVEQAVLAVLARHSAPGGQVYNTIKTVSKAG